MGQITLSEEALCLLFAADRVEHSRDIESHLARREHVVCDRYVLSSIAYQSASSGVTAERVIDANRGIAVPDLTLLLDVPVDACLARLRERSDSPTIYEKRESLERIARSYEDTISRYTQDFGPVVRIDGTQAIDAVHKTIRGHVDALRHA